MLLTISNAQSTIVDNITVFREEVAMKEYLRTIPFSYLQESLQASLVVNLARKKSIHLSKSQCVFFHIITARWKCQSAFKTRRSREKGNSRDQLQASYKRRNGDRLINIIPTFINRSPLCAT